MLYLSEDDVRAAAPSAGELTDLAAQALRAIAAGRVQLPPKTKLVHRPDALANAMPGYVVDADLLGMKWIVIDQANPARGLPATSALVLLVDASTGVPSALLGGRWLTALRTAAASAATIRALAPVDVGHVALVGTGLEARSHLAALAALGPLAVRVAGRSAASVDALVRWCRSRAPGLDLRPARDLEDACRGAGVVVTVVSQRATSVRIEHRWLRPDVLLVPVDYATCVHAELAAGRHLLADDPAQLVAIRDAGGNLRGYRDPDGPTGAALDRPRPSGGIVVQNLGTAIADIVTADAVVARARALGRGIELRP